MTAEAAADMLNVSRHSVVYAKSVLNGGTKPVPLWNRLFRGRDLMRPPLFETWATCPRCQASTLTQHPQG